MGGSDSKPAKPNDKRAIVGHTQRAAVVDAKAARNSVDVSRDSQQPGDPGDLSWFGSPPTRDLDVPDITSSNASIELAQKHGEITEIPTVFRWSNGGRKVYVTGSFNEWGECIEMVKSSNDFTAIINLPPGEHEFKFVVDGEWKHAPDVPTKPDAVGNTNNVVNIHLPEEWDGVAISSDAVTPADAAYSQTIPVVSYKKEPPIVPPHVLKSILNTRRSEDPYTLPVPHHVMLNHLYAQSVTPAGVAVIATTERYKQKFVTTVYYKPFDPET